MEFKATSYNSQPEILKRKLGAELLAPITIASTEFASATVVKAGSPIDADGAISNDGDAIGILLNDVYADNPNGSLIKGFATVNKTVAQAHASITYASACIAGLNNIIFE